jgi:hypothetical protein
VIFGLNALFFGGWWFLAAYAGLMSATWALVRRERRLAAVRAAVVDPRELDQYELAMLDVDEAIDAVLLAVVNLLRQGVLEPGSRWAANRGYGEPVGHRPVLGARRTPDRYGRADRLGRDAGRSCGAGGRRAARRHGKRYRPR